MVAVTISCENVSVNLGHKELADFIYFLQDSNEFHQFFEKILEVGVDTETRYNIAGKFDLPQKIIQRLIEDDQISVAKNVISTLGVAERLSEDQVFSVIERNDVETLCEIATRVNEFKFNTGKVIEVLQEHPDPQVRMALIECPHKRKRNMLPSHLKRIALKMQNDPDKSVKAVAEKLLRGT